MNRRLSILIVLAVVTAFSLIMQSYVWYAYPGIRILLNAGIRAEPFEGVITVYHVSEEDQNGVLYPGHTAGVRAGDRIIGIFDHVGLGRQVRGIFDLYAVARTLKPDKHWTLAVQRDEMAGLQREMRIVIPPPSVPLALNVRIIHILEMILLPFLALITALFIGFSRYEDRNAILAFLLFLGFATIFGNAPIYAMSRGIREICLFHWVTFNTFVPYLFMLFFLIFPSPSWIDRKFPWLKKVLFALMALIWLWNLVYLFAGGIFLPFQRPFEYLSEWFQGVELYSALGMFILGIVSLVMNTVGAATKDDRRRLIILLAGATIGLIPPVVYFNVIAGQGFLRNYWIAGFFLALLGLFPLSFIYAVIMHRVFDIRVILRRGLQYALVSRGVLLVEWLLLFIILFFGAGPILANAFPEAGSSLIAGGTALATFGLLLVLKEINRRLLPAIDRRFFREAYDARQILTELGHAVQRLAAEPRELLRMVTDKLMDSLHADQVAVFALEKSMKEFRQNGFYTKSNSMNNAAAAEENFQCLWRRTRNKTGDPDCKTSGPCKDLFLSGHGPTSRILKMFTMDESEPVDVYMDDPKSWAYVFSDATSPIHPHWAERSLLEELNTHLLVRLVTKDFLLGFISLGEKLSEEPYTREDKELLQSVGQQVAMAIDYAKLIRQAEDQARLSREIEIAKDVQNKLFPSYLPEMVHLDYTGICRAARGVGGDYYDFVEMGPHKLGIAMGDIAGKGVSAALLMANLQAMLRSRAMDRGLNLAELMGDINRQLCSTTDSQKFASFFYGLLDEESGRMIYVNAGHNPPMIFRPNGKQAELSRLDATGMIVGVFPDSPYRQAAVDLEQGDVMVLFSDGIPEARNKSMEEFGEDRLISLVSENLHLTASGIQDVVISNVRRFVEDTPLYDDMTMVVAKVV